MGSKSRLLFQRCACRARHVARQCVNLLIKRIPMASAWRSALERFEWLKECCYIKLILLYIIIPLPVLIASAIVLKNAAYVVVPLMFAFYVAFTF
jgi:hypothetical protein